MSKYKTTIGIEIHIELNTKTKMFSSSPNNFDEKPNVNISPVDVAYPGTLPVVNKEAVIKAIKLAKALNMKIDSLVRFDRKHYFYPDLPKGFQITQQNFPIGKNGKLKISGKEIQIERIHLEEDTAKSIHVGNLTKLDYNRAGVPLIEIVTEPVIKNANEAIEYISSIRNLVRFIGISDAKMEEGSLRADINISLNEASSEKLGTKVEIKNINSLSNVEQAIKKEIEHQTKSLNHNEKIQQATKRFDEASKDTVVMRVKTEQEDYKYLPEPNIPPIQLEKGFVDSITTEDLPWDIQKQLEEKGVNKNFVEQLLNSKDKLDFFNSVNYSNSEKWSKIFFAEIVSLANNKNCKVKELNILPSEIEILLNELDLEKISGSQIKKIIPLLVNNKKVSDIISNNNFSQISNTDEIGQLLDKIIESNKDFIETNKERPERIMKFLIGQLMKETKGQANPVSANKILKEKLGE